MVRRRVAELAIASVLILGVLTVPTPAAADSCVTYDVVGARGTDAPPKDENNDGIITSLQYANAPDDARGVITDAFRSVFDGLVIAQGGSVSSYGVRYLAKGQFPLAFKFVPGLEAEWDASYQLGSADVADHIGDVLTTCPSTKFVLVGYSQGAEVMGGAMPLLSSGERDQIAAVALFGDPEFNGGDSAANRTHPTVSGCGAPETSGAPFWMRRYSPIATTGTSPAKVEPRTSQSMVTSSRSTPSA